MQDLEKCDRQTEDGVTNKASTREACASKKLVDLARIPLRRKVACFVENYVFVGFFG